MIGKILVGVGISFLLYVIAEKSAWRIWDGLKTDIYNKEEWIAIFVDVSRYHGIQKWIIRTLVLFLRPFLVKGSDENID